VTPQAQFRIRRAAELYVARNPHLAEHALRFDIIVVTPWSWPRHLVDAWRDS
jgi:putative endonuclease